MNKKVKIGLLTLVVLVNSVFVVAAEKDTVVEKEYQQLVNLFKVWRQFEKPPLYKGAPDYRQATFEKRFPKFLQIRSQLSEINKQQWPIDKQVDWMILWAELNGFEFNYKVLKPWQRDPAFYKTVWTYKSDVPAHEGPSHHALTELWSYQFPLGEKQQQQLVNDLKIIHAINEQAKRNLSGNARELWIAGIRDIKEQSQVLTQLKSRVEKNASPELLKAIIDAKTSSDDLAEWLEKQSKTKTGQSGIGKTFYSWYLQNVHLVPLSWQDEVNILKRELDRSWSSLKLEEHRNRKLPQLEPVKNQTQYDALAKRSAKKFLKFLDEQEILTVADYFKPALDQHLGQFVPVEKRNFFYIGSHLDPTPLYSHFYHWFELARMEHEPNPSLLRRSALLYNIFDSRNEGTATAVEEMFMQAGLYDDNPRVREIVWIMIAQRAARGLGSLYAHANSMTMQEGGNIHTEWTPRGWMKTEPELLIFEQHLYLRQPGYGTSYISGKYLLERTMADYAKQLEEQGKPFRLKSFFDQLNKIGNIPIALSRWQMTGLDDEIVKIRNNYQPLSELQGE